jgi:hypothetical protein
VSIYKEVFVKGYYRKNGVFISPHIRKIKVSRKFKGTKILKSYQSVDKNQLSLNFSGKTLN